MVVLILHVCRMTNDSSDINVIALLVLAEVIKAINPIELSADLPLKTCDKNIRLEHSCAYLNLDGMFSTYAQPIYVKSTSSKLALRLTCMKNLTKPI